MRIIALSLVLAAGPVLADTDPTEIELSPAMEHTVGLGLDMAAQQLWRKLEPYSSDGETVDLSNMGDALAKNLAERRAQKVYRYLSADLDWDGQVTRAELEQVFDGADEAPFVDGWLKDGDLDGDGVISLKEMHNDAILEYPDTDRPSNGYVREMLAWDLNADGILHFEEVIMVIVANQR